MPKKRPHVPAPVRRSLFIEAGYRCSIWRCTAESSLEIHHIDGNPSNNAPENLLVLCANHHAQATSGKIDRLACRAIKSSLRDKGHTTVDHEKIAKLVAEEIRRSGAWPDPASDRDLSMSAVAAEIETSLGARVEMAVRQGDRVGIWLRSTPSARRDTQVLIVAIACVLSGLRDIQHIEVGFSSASGFPGSVGGEGVVAFWVRVPLGVARRTASTKRLDQDFWNRTQVLLLREENSPHMRVEAIPFSDFEERVQWF